MLEASASSPGIGTSGPLVVEAIASDARWVVYCQAREDSDRNGKLEVSVGARGELAGDSLKAYLTIEGQEERPVDVFVSADPTGKYLIFLRRDHAILLDTQAGTELDLTELGADTRFDAAPYRGHRALSFDATGEHLLYVRRDGPRSNLVVRTLATGVEQAYDPGPGDLWRAEFERSGGFIVLQHVREDTNKDRRISWPVPLEKNPASLRCRGPIQNFPSFQDYGDRPQITLLPLSGGFPRLSPDLATPFGTELIFRDAAGTLWLERPGGNHPLNSAKCAGRIHHADAIRRMIIVGCVRKRGKRDLYLSGPGFIKNLNISVAEAELDEWANGSPRLVPLYPGADAAVLDMDQRELLFLHRGDVVLATKNGSALVRRGNTLVVYDATTRGEDECPDDPEDFDGFQDGDGCPDPDNDQDGILDVDDRCPNVPEDRDGDQDEDGCPEMKKEGDRDGDGILDSKDKCPDDPEDRDGFEDLDGCPEADNDKDGIPDKEDSCPNDAEDRDKFEDADGCPDPDNDKDQIPDVKDKCPNDPETYNGFQDEDGCPDKGKVIIEGNEIMILEKVQFETGSAKILPQSNEILNAVAATLKGHPEFLVIEVAGHADERAGDDLNLRLTKARAASVLEALKSRGVAPNRIVSQGYGEYCPADDRSNPQAWEKNRRVEFKVVKTEDGDTGVPRGCPKAKEKGVLPPPVR